MLSQRVPDREQLAEEPVVVFRCLTMFRLWTASGGCRGHLWQVVMWLGCVFLRIKLPHLLLTL